MIRFETDLRWYFCDAHKGLLGWELWRAWGGKGNSTGGSLVVPAVYQAHAEQLLASLVRTRLARGYRPVPTWRQASAG